MTRVRAKRMKDVLQSLVADVHNNEFTLEASKNVLKVSKASPRMITYFCMWDLEEQGRMDKALMLSL